MSNEATRVEFIYSKQILNIAHKSYLTGCQDVKIDKNCHKKALEYKGSLQNFLDSVETN